MKSAVEDTVSISVSDLRHRFPGDIAPALDAVSLTVHAGEIVALVGPSGAGKSTLMTLLDGRLRRWSGAARVLGRALSPNAPPPRAARPETGFIFQDFALVDRASVRRNVLNGRLGRMGLLPSLFRAPEPADRDAVERALAEVGLADFTEKRVDQLSGGQRQRVAIARCLAQEPRLILADEPVSSLDPQRARDVLRLLAGVARARGATLVFSSHQPDLAAEVASRIVALKAGRVALDVPAKELTEAALREIYGPGGAATRNLRLAG